MNQLYQQFGAPQPGRSGLMGFLSQARQMMQGIRNPQQFVLQNLTGIPPEIQNDPNAILQYGLQNNMFSDDQKALIQLYQQGGLRL